MPRVIEDALVEPVSRVLLGDAFRRGSQCRGDFTAVDHLALAEVPLVEVRDRFGVPPLG
jgi:hypothetical protein